MLLLLWYWSTSLSYMFFYFLQHYYKLKMFFPSIFRTDPVPSRKLGPYLQDALSTQLSVPIFTLKLNASYLWVQGRSKCLLSTSAFVSLCFISSVQLRGWPAGEELCGEGLGCSGGQQLSREPAVCPCGQEGQWDAFKRAWPAGRGRWSAPSTLPWWGHI